MFRRHPYLTFFGLLTALLLLACGIFLATFDLNRYRENLQTSLSKALSRPVRLGEAHLSWHFGPAFEFADLHIAGKEDEAPLLQVDSLYLQPKILPLLIGRIDFDKIVLDQPRLLLNLTAEAEGPSPPSLLHAVLTTIRVDSITIREGTLKLIDRRLPDAPFEAELQQLQVEASRLFSRSRGRLRIEALLVQQQEHASLKLYGRLTLPSQPTEWQEGRANLDLALQRLAVDTLPPRFRAAWGITEARGRLDAHLALAGSPAEGLLITAGLTGDDLALQIPELYSHPLTLHDLAFSGRWTASAEMHTLADLSLRVDGLSLDGHLTLQRETDNPWLEGHISTPYLPVQEIWRLLPDRLPSIPVVELSSRFPAGTLSLDRARIAGQLTDYRQGSSVLPLQAADFRIRDGQLNFGGKESLQQISANLAFADRNLHLTEGRAMLADSPLQFSANMEGLFDTEMKTTLGAGWVLPADRLAALLPEKALPNLTGEGPVPISLTLNGKGRVFEMNLRADFDACTLSYEPVFRKKTGTNGKLEITATLSPDSLLLTRGRLDLGPAGLTVTGERWMTDKGNQIPAAAQPFRLRGELAETDLAAMNGLLPPLEKFRLSGQLAGHYTLEGTGTAVKQAGGSLTGRNLGVHFSEILQGELQGFNGRATLLRDRMEWSGVTGRLGENPVTIGGKLRNWASPRVELDIAAPKISTADLVFPSSTAILHNTAGRLIFTRDEILFEKIKTSLGENTIATVDGNHRYKPIHTTTLDASAEKADIDEVVALFQGMAKKDRPAGELPQFTVIVNSRAERGSYGPWNFRKAEGTVTVTPGALHIDPLQFSLGRGKGRGGIAILHKSGTESQLNISGHLENVGAETLHRKAFPENKPQLSGRLTGDFALQGLIGDRFLETSSGNFHIAVADGVLYRFAFLAKLFSLLNVSQILTLNLPDMAREGMPFSILEGTFALNGGKLSTEDLFLTSNAMNLSLIGTADLVNNELDLLAGVKPFRTVDKIVTHIPIAGWLLTGDEKALITAHFEITGKSEDPEVRAVPVTSLSGKVLGIFKRVLGLPGKAITDPAGLITGQEREDKR